MIEIINNNIKDVLKLALPAVGEMILYMLIWIFDTMMVGKYGGNITVTAVGLSGQIIYTIMAIFVDNGISIASVSLVARSVGASNHKKAERYATVGFQITIILSVIISIVFYIFAENIIKLAGASDEVIILGSTYIRICSVQMLFSMLKNNLSSILRGQGDTKTPLYASIIVNVINIGLDWVLIFGKYGFPEMGVKGAAIATSVGSIGGFIYIWYYLSKSDCIKPQLKDLFKVDVKALSEIVRLAIPASLQEAATSIVRLLNVFMIMSLGSVAFSANEITISIESLSFMPGWGFAVASTTLVGQQIGKRDYKKAKAYGNTSIGLSALIMGVCAAMFLIIPETIVSLFIKTTEVETIKLGVSCLLIASLEQIPMAITMTSEGILKGMGDTKKPFYVGLIVNWCVRLPLVYYFIVLKRCSITYVWWITALQWTLQGAISYSIYRIKLNKLIKLQIEKD